MGPRTARCVAAWLALLFFLLPGPTRCDAAAAAVAAATAAADEATDCTSALAQPCQPGVEFR